LNPPNEPAPPDPRVVSMMTRSQVSTGWVEYWNKVLYLGALPHKPKEMCPIRFRLSTNVAIARPYAQTLPKAGGLTEDVINDLFSYENSKHFTPREKAALRYADLFKQGEHAIDKDEVYQELSKHFSDEEIIELGLLCAQTVGVGKFVKSLNVLSWDEACQLNPKLTRASTREVAE
jgi:hypothetical protein